MKIIKYKCDICGKEATKERPVYNLIWQEQTLDGSDGDLDQVVDGVSEKDICGVCALKAGIVIAEALQRWMDTKQPEEKKQPETKKPDNWKIGKKKNLDEGKMLALRKAGWTYAQIADEVGCTQQTVINRIQNKE